MPRAKFVFQTPVRIEIDESDEEEEDEPVPAKAVLAQLLNGDN